MNSEDCILIDGNNLLYRAHWAYHDLTTSKGEPTSVLHGFLVMLVDLLTRCGGADVVLLWDRGSPFSTTEHKTPLWKFSRVSKEYKANRVERTEGQKIAISQLLPLADILQKAGFYQMGFRGMEADDLMGIGSRALVESGSVRNVYLFSNDEDLYQLATKRVRILAPRPRQFPEILTPADLLRKTGFKPPQWPLYRALAGDKSDNIKAIKGIGPVKAARYIRGGVDPSVQMWEDLPEDVRLEFPELEKHWNRIFMCFLLSYIPRRPSFGLLPDEAKEKLPEVIEELTTIRRKRPFRNRTEIKASAKAVWGCLKRYELNYVASILEGLYANCVGSKHHDDETEC